MTAHAKNALGGPRVSEVLDLALAVPTTKACCAERLVAGEDCKILDLVAASTAAICTIITDQRAIAEEEEVRIRVE